MQIVTKRYACETYPNLRLGPKLRVHGLTTSDPLVQHQVETCLHAHLITGTVIVTGGEDPKPQQNDNSLTPGQVRAMKKKALEDVVARLGAEVAPDATRENLIVFIFERMGWPPRDSPGEGLEGPEV